MFVDNKSPGKASQSLTLIYDHVQIFKSSQKDKGSIQNTYAYRKSYKDNRVIFLCTSAVPSVNIPLILVSPHLEFTQTQLCV